MGKKLCCLALIFCSTFLFSNCNEESVNPQSADENSSTRKGGGPIANAGSDKTIVLPTNSTIVDGSLSKTFDGVEKYKWDKITGPDAFSISDPLSKITSLSDLVEGMYTFRLTVTDGKNRKATDDVTLQVNKEVTGTSSPSPLTDEFYFQGNMDNVSITTSGSKLVLNGWDELKTHPYVESLELNNSGSTSYVYQAIKPEPLNPDRNSLFATILDDDPNLSGNSRAQMSLRFKDGVDLSVYHTSHRIYLSPDIAYMENYSSSITWFDIFEIWNKRVEGWDGDVAGSARWSLYINKDSGAGQPLYWVMKSEYMQPAARVMDNIWKYTNKQIAIPLGKWVTFDLYMKRGEGSNGRLIVKITPDGGPTQVVFDITNTTIYPGHPEIQLKSWQPFKLYLNDIYLDWMRANGKSISAYYNDFKWYKN